MYIGLFFWIFIAFVGSHLLRAIWFHVPKKKNNKKCTALLLCFLLAGTLASCQNTADVPSQTSSQSVTSSSSHPEPSSSAVEEEQTLKLPDYIADYDSGVEVLSGSAMLNLTLRRTDLEISMEEAAPAGKDIWVECIESLLLRPAKSGEGMKTPRGIAFEVEFEDPATGRRDVFSFADGEPVRYAGGQWMPESEGRMWKLEDCYEWEPFLAADPFPLGELLDFNPEEVSEFRATETIMGGYVDETAVMYGDEARQAARELCGMLVYDAKKFTPVDLRIGGRSFDYEVISDKAYHVSAGLYMEIEPGDSDHYARISDMVTIPESAYPELELPDQGLDPELFLNEEGMGRVMLFVMTADSNCFEIDEPRTFLEEMLRVAEFVKADGKIDPGENPLERPGTIRFDSAGMVMMLYLFPDVDQALFTGPLGRNATFYDVPAGTYERIEQWMAQQGK